MNKNKTATLFLAGITILAVISIAADVWMLETKKQIWLEVRDVPFLISDVDYGNPQIYKSRPQSLVNFTMENEDEVKKFMATIELNFFWFNPGQTAWPGATSAERASNLEVSMNASAYTNGVWDAVNQTKLFSIPQNNDTRILTSVNPPRIDNDTDLMVFPTAATDFKIRIEIYLYVKGISTGQILVEILFTGYEVV